MSIGILVCRSVSGEFASVVDVWKRSLSHNAENPALRHGNQAGLIIDLPTYGTVRCSNSKCSKLTLSFLRNLFSLSPKYPSFLLWFPILDGVTTIHSKIRNHLTVSCVLSMDPVSKTTLPVVSGTHFHFVSALALPWIRYKWLPYGLSTSFLSLSTCSQVFGPTLHQCQIHPPHPRECDSWKT